MRGEPAVVRFIQEQKQKGTSEKKIKEMLLQEGWHMDIIHHAMKVDLPKQKASIPPTQAKPAHYHELRKLIKIWLVFIAVVTVLLLFAE
jgi:hypothetical protein